MPDSVKIGEAFVEFLGRNEKLLQSVKQNEAALTQLTSVYERQTAKVETSIGRQTKAFNQLRETSRHVRTQLDQVGNRSAIAKDKIRLLGSETTTLRRKLNGTTQTLNAMQTRIQSLSTSLDRAIRRLDRLGVTSSRANQQLAASTQGVTQATQNVVVAQQANARAADGVAQATNRAERAKKRATDTTKGFDRTLTAITLTLAQYRIVTIAMTAAATTFAAISYRSAATFEQAFAGVLKTVEEATDKFGGLTQEGRLLEAGILDLAGRIPIVSSEIAKITEVTGQLGIEGTQNLLSYTNVVARLGVSTDLATQEAALGIARLNGILGYDNPLGTGSILTRLGNTFRVTERQILNYATRVAGVGAVVGLTVDEVLAIGAAAASAGLQVEAGGTAIQRTFIAMAQAVADGGDDLNDFARIAGYSSDQFLKAWNEDKQRLIIDFFKGINEGGTSVLTLLDNLGLADVRITRFLLSTGRIPEIVEDAFQTASDEIETQSALIEESNRFFDTFYGTLQRLNNQLDNMAVTLSRNVLPSLTSMLDYFANLIEQGRGVTAVLGIIALAAGAVAIPLAGAGGILGVTGSALLGPELVALAKTLGIVAGAAGAGYGIGQLFDTPFAQREAVHPAIDQVAEDRERLETEIGKLHTAREDLEVELQLLERTVSREQHPEAYRSVEGRIAGISEQIAALTGTSEQRSREIQARDINQYETLNELLEYRTVLSERLGRLQQELGVAPDERAIRDILGEISVVRRDIEAVNAAYRDIALATPPRDFTQTHERDFHMTVEEQLAITRHLQARRELEREIARGKQIAALQHEQTRREAERELEINRQLAELAHEQNRRERERDIRRAAQTARSQHIQSRREAEFPFLTRAINEGFVTDLGGRTFEEAETDLIALAEHLLNVEHATRRVSQAFGTMFERLITGSQGVGDILIRLVAQLSNLAIQNFALNPLFNALFENSRFLASAFARGGFGQPVAVTNLPARGGPLGPRFQHGGFHTGGFALVGERGPELVDFRTPSRIYSNDDLESALQGRGGEGTVINYSPVIQSSDTDAVRRALADSFPAFERLVEERITRKLQRRSTMRVRVTGR